MKFNWGHGIALFVLVFVCFILSLVYRCSKQQVDLVSEKYYDNEIHYQQQINRETNTNKLQQPVKLVYADKAITLFFPSDISTDSIAGDIQLFKPDDAGKDIKLQVKPGKDHQQIIACNEMARGVWNVKVNWSAGNLPYYFEQRILIDKK